MWRGLRVGGEKVDEIVGQRITTAGKLYGYAFKPNLPSIRKQPINILDLKITRRSIEKVIKPVHYLFHPVFDSPGNNYHNRVASIWNCKNR